MPNPANAEFKYWAFISYSHRDTRWSEWLHRKLEHYQVPRSLVGRDSRNGPIPKSIAPVFRDRDELSATHDLGIYLKSSLVLSRHLIVICSPNSARSKWVEEEIRYFKGLGREDRVLCLIVDGEPDSPDRECFPEVAKFHLAPDGSVTLERVHPIAADARPGADGKANAAIKLLAGLLDVDYDSLQQREKRRRRRRLFETALLVFLILTGFCLLWDFEKEFNRQEVIEGYRQNISSWEGLGKLQQACVYLAAAYPLLTPAERESDEWLKRMRHDSRSLIHEEFVLRGHGDRVEHGTFSPDGQTVLTCGWDSTVRLWDLREPPPIHSTLIHTNREKYHDIFLCTNYSPDGDRILCTTWWSALCWISDFDGGLVGRLIEDHRGRVNDAEYNAEGTQFITASDDCTARLFHANGYPIKSFGGSLAGLKSACFSPDGKKILTACFDGTARIWSVESGEVILTVNAGTDDKLNSAAFSPNGDCFVTGGLGKKARIWSSTTGQLLQTFSEDHGRLNRVSFNRSGDLVLSASDDDTAKIWNAHDASLELSLEGHEGHVVSAAFSPDGSRVVTTGEDHTARVWKLSDAPPRDIDWPDFIARVQALPWYLKGKALLSHNSQTGLPVVPGALAK